MDCNNSCCLLNGAALCSELYCAVLFVLHCIAMYCIALCIVLYFICIVLYFVVVYCIVFFAFCCHLVLYCMYCIVLYIESYFGIAAGSKMVPYLEAKGTAAEASLDLGIETKSGSADFCTKVDVENEKLVIDGIRRKFPNHNIIGEESVGVGTIPDLDPGVPTWIIDPIDGTTNFSSGLHSLTCVSIGYCVDGKPVVGVIYAPGTNELYVAVDGCGAYRNGKPIFQDPNESTKSLGTAVVCNEMGYARNKADMDTMMGAQARVMLKGCRAMRQLGSGCLDLCFVASGRLDVVYAGLCNEGWKPWDYAAGLLICKEAGCTMESIKEQERSGCDGFDLYGKSVICGVSKELVDELRSVVLDK
mmetsp:Transcript_25665/g.54834  ORF Transcript_25665/g.54834 Transcript_25665/m.54834 type:complete len:360 (+) Transcript_25665:86-1165(+)